MKTIATLLLMLFCKTASAQTDIPSNENQGKGFMEIRLAHPQPVDEEYENFIGSIKSELTVWLKSDSGKRLSKEGFAWILQINPVGWSKINVQLTPKILPVNYMGRLPPRFIQIMSGYSKPAEIIKRVADYIEAVHLSQHQKG